MSKKNAESEQVSDAPQPADPRVVFAGADVAEPEAAKEAAEDRGDNLDPLAVDDEAPETEVVLDKDEEEAEEPATEEEAETEEEPESEEEAETEEEPEAEEEEDPAPKKDIRIPKDRFDQVNDRRKKAEARAKELEAEIEALRKEQQGETDEGTDREAEIEALEEKYSDLVFNGEHAEAQAIRKQIRAIERQVMKAELAQEIEPTVNANRERKAYIQTAAEVITEYPILDPKAETFQPKTHEKMMGIYRGLLSMEGYDAPTALREAAETVLRVTGQWVDADAQDTAEAARVEKRTKAVKAGVKAKAESVDKQPPVTARGKQKSDLEGLQDVAALSDAEFDALPPAVKARLRGDAAIH